MVKQLKPQSKSPQILKLARHLYGCRQHYLSAIEALQALNCLVNPSSLQPKHRYLPASGSLPRTVAELAGSVGIGECRNCRSKYHRQTNCLYRSHPHCLQNSADVVMSNDEYHLFLGVSHRGIISSSRLYSPSYHWRSRCCCCYFLVILGSLIITGSV